MRKQSRQPRPGKPSRRPDLSVIKKALQDGRCWACMGLVVDGEDGGHFEISDGADVLVEVSLMPSEERITARLGAIAGGPGRGVWAIPPVGAEVAVIVPDGTLSFMPIIVATLSSGEVPSELDDTIVTISNNLGDIAVVPMSDVKLGDASATEQALRGNSFQSTFNSFVSVFNSHVHSGVTSGGSTSGPSTTPGVPSAAGDLSPNVKVA